MENLQAGGPYWVRSPDGWIAGVCQGLAESFHLPVGLVRAGWVVSILFAGTGLGLYLLFCISLPRADLWAEAQYRRVLGVCARLSKKLNAEVGVVRFIFLLSLFISMGLTLVLYVILYFLIDSKPELSVK